MTLPSCLLDFRVMASLCWEQLLDAKVRSLLPGGEVKATAVPPFHGCWWRVTGSLGVDRAPVPT